MAITPDFDCYPCGNSITRHAITREGQALWLKWDDGLEHEFHFMLLREHASDEKTNHPVTKEQILSLTDIDSALKIDRCDLNNEGLEIGWSDHQRNVYDIGWLRAHSEKDFFVSPKMAYWGAGFSLPCFEYEGIRDDLEVRLDWLESFYRDGVVCLKNTPVDENTITDIASLIGVIRRSNFGTIFDVRVKHDDADSVAYTPLELPLHMDLTTREYQPGLQFLHCMQNASEGGFSTLADAFYLTEQFQKCHPDHYRALANKAIIYANKAATTDYRHSVPVIATSVSGELIEIRYNPWLRAPMHADFEDSDKIYRALKTYFQFCEQNQHRIFFKLSQGDLLCFDNRRILHGRTAYEDRGGERWLRGCYVEREELESAIRMTKRHIRKARMRVA